LTQNSSPLEALPPVKYKFPAENIHQVPLSVTAVQVPVTTNWAVPFTEVRVILPLTVMLPSKSAWFTLGSKDVSWIRKFLPAHCPEGQVPVQSKPKFPDPGDVNTPDSYFQIASHPDFPEVPEVPDVPEVPEDPEDPEDPLVPEEPDVPDVPEEPEVPEEPLVPEEPEVPEVPEDPLVPEEPELPDVPEDPLVPEVPEEPEVPEVPSDPCNVTHLPSPL